MGIHQSYISSDDVFNKTHHAKVIVNDLSNRTTKDKAVINNLLMLEVGDVFDNVPSCSCGALSINIYKGVRCRHCDTVSEEIVSRDLDNKMWVRTPKGVPALMNTMMWHQLQSYLERSNFKFNLLRWLTDPSYKPTITSLTKPIRTMLQRLDEVNLNVRDYRHFYDNFDTYIRFLLTEKEFRKESESNRNAGEDLLNLFIANRHLVWQQYIQIPNKAVTIVENSNGKKWIDPSTPKLLKAIRLMVGIDNDENTRGGLSVRTKLSRASKFLSFMGEYYGLEINPKFLGSKPGEIRKHVIATRSNFTGRFVVTAITTPHDYDEVHLPWVGFMGIFAPHIRAKLYNKFGYSASKVNEIMTKYQKVYHDGLYGIMLELMEEARNPNGKYGIPMLINRNPSLMPGSIVLLRCTKVKTDVRDLSASTSGTIAPLYNGDYDGDQETFMATLDYRTTKAFVPFSARYSVGELTDPFTIAGEMSLPKQTTMSIANAIIMGEQQKPTEEQNQFMARFSV